MSGRDGGLAAGRARARRAAPVAHAPATVRTSTDEATDERLDAAFAALADPTRRGVLRLLTVESRRAGELAELLQVSPPALSRHLKVLRDAGLVSEQGLADDARVRLYRLEGAALGGAQGWLDEVEAHWRDQLTAFKEYAERTRRPAPKPR